MKTAKITHKLGEVRISKDSRGLVFELPQGMSGAEYKRLREDNADLIDSMNEEEESDEGDISERD